MSLIYIKGQFVRLQPFQYTLANYSKGLIVHLFQKYNSPYDETSLWISIRK